jgi:hypothetical protein
MVAVGRCVAARFSRDAQVLKLRFFNRWPGQLSPKR